MLVGREREIEELRRTLREFSDRGRNICLTGGRGCGKSTLMRRFQDIASEEEWACVRSDVTPAYNVPSSLVPLVVSHVADAATQLSLARRVGQRMTVRPTVALEVTKDLTLTLRLAEHTPVPSPEALYKAFFKLAEIAERKERRVVLCYDEAQRLRDDPGSGATSFYDLLTAILRVQEDMPWIMLLLGGLPPLHRQMVAARENASREFSRLQLDQLDGDSRDGAPSAAANLLIATAQAGSTPAFHPDAAAMIAARLMGNPEALQHVGGSLADLAMRHRVDGIDVAFVKERWDSVIARMDLELFSSRYENLGVKERELVRGLAGRYGDSFDEREIHAVAGRRLKRSLDVLVEKEYVFLGDDDRYSFDHVLFGDYLRRRPAS